MHFKKVLVGMLETELVAGCPVLSGGGVGWGTLPLPGSLC